MQSVKQNEEYMPCYTKFLHIQNLNLFKRVQQFNFYSHSFAITFSGIILSSVTKYVLFRFISDHLVSYNKFFV